MRMGPLVLWAMVLMGNACGGPDDHVLCDLGNCVSSFSAGFADDLEPGDYLVSVTTEAGVTECEVTLAAPTMEKAADPAFCSDPDIIRVEPSQLEVIGEPAMVTVTVERVSTGWRTSETFTPAYWPKMPTGSPCDDLCQVGTAMLPALAP